MINAPYRCGRCGQSYHEYKEAVRCLAIHERDAREAKTLGYMTIDEVMEKTREDLSSRANKRPER